MTTLVSSDFTKIKQIVRNNPTLRDVFKAWSLDKSDWMALFQVAEDYFVGAFSSTPVTSYKTAIDAVATSTSAQAQAVFEIWVNWKLGDL